MSTAVAITGPADLRDQQWLSEQVATLGDGYEAARAIWSNWSDLRNVSRFHPGQSAGDFIAAQFGGVRLDLPRLIAALPDMSNRQLAAVAGVDQSTVYRARERVANATPDPDQPAVRVIGADGKSYPGRVVGTADIIEPEVQEKGKVRQKINLTEARGYVRVITNNLAMLQPDEVVPSAYPVLRELAPALMAWVQLWKLEDDAEGVK